MKVLGAMLFLALSTDSFAGLFCESFKCDLSVSPYADRVVSTRTESREAKIARPLTSKENFATLLESRAKQAKVLILDNNDEAMKVFNQPGVRIKSCTSEFIDESSLFGGTYLETVKVSESESYTQTVVPLKLTCTLEILDKKSNAEMAEALCQRAMQCAASVDSVDKLASYIKLKDGLCGKNADTITPTLGVDSSGRSSAKENKINDGGSYDNPSQTISK